MASKTQKAARKRMASKKWFLHKNSCLDHCNHLPIADEAMAKRANEMTDRDVSMVSYLLLSMFMYA